MGANQVVASQLLHVEVVDASENHPLNGLAIGLVDRPATCPPRKRSKARVSQKRMKREGKKGRTLAAVAGSVGPHVAHKAHLKGLRELGAGLRSRQGHGERQHGDEDERAHCSVFVLWGSTALLLLIALPVKK